MDAVRVSVVEERSMCGEAVPEGAVDCIGRENAGMSSER